MTRRWRYVHLVLYYAVGTHLPNSNLPFGRLWRGIRGALCRGFFASAGDGINIESGVFVADGRNVRIGSGSGFGSGSRVYGVEMGDNVIVGPNVVFLKDNHRYEDPLAPIQSQGLTSSAPPIIEDWAWIGERAIILPGRRVGRGAIVGAGAVVARDVPAYQIVGGNPARVIGQRPRP